ncbi:MAG: hypothetical protein IKN12_05715 [Selenomonadaceae bacterium]|nr:hypothetical protein [Selenomonadaceae bacterium]
MINMGIFGKVLGVKKKVEPCVYIDPPFVYEPKIVYNKKELPKDYPVGLVSEEYVVQENPDTVFKWPNIDGSTIKLRFQTACEIKSRSIGEGIREAVFLINGQEFTCRDSMAGDVVEAIFDEDRLGTKRIYNVRKLKSGIKALRHYHNIPTFDSDDREWDGDFNISIYKDKQGINLIHTRSGYRIPRVYIFVGLQEWDTEFESWLKYL